MSEWRQRGYVQDSDEEEDESLAESEDSKQVSHSHGRVERVLATRNWQKTDGDAIAEGQNDAASSIEVFDERVGGSEVKSIATTPARLAAPTRPTPSPLTPSTRTVLREALSESPDPLQSPSDLPQWSHRLAASSRLPRSPTLQRSSQDEIQLRAHALPSQILGETTIPVHEFSRTAGLGSATDSAILAELGAAALSDGSQDELLPDQASDVESTLSDYPSDLSDAEPQLSILYATPHRRTAVQVVIPSSTALQHQLAQEEARRRHFRQRKPIQLHPYVLEGERYRREVQSRGLKPVPRERSPQRRQGQTNTETQEEDFNPSREYSNSPPDPEILVSTPASQQQARRIIRSSDKTKRSRSDSTRRGSPATQLRVPKPAKRRRMNGSLTEALATPARTSDGSPIPSDIWSFPHDSPPYSSSPPLNTQLGKLLATSNTDSLPTPSNSSTFRDDPQPMVDSDSDHVPRSAQRSGGELQRPTRIVLSDEPSSDPDEASSESEQADGELQKVSKKMRGVLPASWLRIDRQAQERQQMLARQRARLDAAQSSEPLEPQRGVAHKVTKSSDRYTKLAQATAAPSGAVIVLDESDHELELEVSAYRQTDNVQHSAENASALAAIFDDRYADSVDDLASMEHDRLHLPTLEGSGAKRKRQTKIRDAFEKTGGTSTSTRVAKSRRLPKFTSGSSARRRPGGPQKVLPPSPPALSVMDVELPSHVPQFLKLARRAARRHVDQARQSPRHKQIRLHTAGDTEDANAALRQWRQGLLQVKRTTAFHQDSRTPLANTTDNRQHSLWSKHLNNGTLDCAEGTHSERNKTYMRLLELERMPPALKMLQRTPSFVNRPSRSNRLSRTVKAPVKVPLRGPRSFRAAQLEGDEMNFGHSHRKLAFQKGLHSVDQQPCHEQAPKQSFMNPQLARFLAEDDAVLPPLPTAKEIGEIQNRQLTGAITISNTSTQTKRFTRKSKAKRLDVDARKYRQPSEPMFHPAVASPICRVESVSLEPCENVLQEFGPFGTRYPITFDVTPLKSDTYFHSSTFVGSEDLRRALSIGRHDARDLNEPAGYCTISQGSRTIKCGPWNDETHSQVHEMVTAILAPLDDNCGQEVSKTHMEEVSASLSLVLRALALYFTDHLSFMDPIDRQNFTTKMQHLLQMLSDRLSVTEQTESTSRVLSYLLVVSVQVQRIGKHPVAVDQNMPKLLDTIRDTSLSLIRNIIKETKEFFAFHEKNKLHKERENGIRDHDAHVESVVICMHTLELLDTPSLGFWDLISQELSLLLFSTNRVPVFENVWATIFTLVPFTELDLSGIPDRSRTRFFDNDNWGCLCYLLKRVFGFYVRKTGQGGSAINDYIRANLARCYVLINSWHWNHPDQILNVIFDFFGKHGLKPLQDETATSSAYFLQNFAAGASGLSLTVNESSFHIALKCLITGLQSMKKGYPEKRVRSFVFRRIPNHGRTYPKDQPLDAQSLAALRNNYDLLSALYCAAPPSCRPKLDRICSLISHETSHREACRLSVRAWENLATFQLSVDEPYEAAKPFALWYKAIMQQTWKQYRLAKIEAEEYLKSGILDGTTKVSEIMVRQTMENNQVHVIATLHHSIAGMKRAIEHARDQAKLASFLDDSGIVHLLELLHIEDHRLVSIIRDTLLVLRQYVTKQRAQVQQPESQSKSEESQDYGDFPGLDDLDDMDGTEVIPLIQTENTPRLSRLDFIQGPLWSLMSNVFGAEHSPDDNLLMDCIDTWVLVASDQVRAGEKQWSDYLDSFGHGSWQQLRHTEQTRKFSPYFMSAVVTCDSTAYREHQHEFLTGLLLSLADRESMLRFQYRLLDAIVRTNGDHPLLRNLPFLRIENGGLDITLNSLQSRRLALISSLLSNMRDDVYATTVQAPERTAEVKRSYAAMLKDFMIRLRSNYQQLQQGASVTGAYVEFVQKIVQFLKQYTGDIYPVLPFFTDSVAFPLPATDPTYVVGRLCGYAPKTRDPGTTKQLSVFMQTVAQQAAADNHQVYLTDQLTTALCSEEAPLTDRLALRTVLLQSIFPAYIEVAFSSRTGHLIAGPILQCLPAVLDNMIFDLRVTQIESVSTIIRNMISIAHAFIRNTEHLKGDATLFQRPSILNSLVFMFEVVMSIFRLLDYIVDRTVVNISRGRPPLVNYFEEVSTYITQIMQGTLPDDVPSYCGDANVAPSDAYHMDVLEFCKSGLQSSLETNWSDDGHTIWFGQGRAKKEVVYDIGSTDTESERLMRALQRFQEARAELSGSLPRRLDDEDDIIV